MKDPIVEDIHKVREAYARRFNYDRDAIFADIQAKQANHPDLVDLSKEPMPKSARVAEGPADYGKEP